MSPRRAACVLFCVALNALAGCRAADCQAPDHSSAAVSGPASTAPVANGGGLLQTGAIQLGPGVGNNLWRWQSDYPWGLGGSRRTGSRPSAGTGEDEASPPPPVRAGSSAAPSAFGSPF
jgi:hypothetical protein